MRIALALVVVVACGGPSKPAPEPVVEQHAAAAPDPYDKDGDHVENANDPCPDDPENVNGYEDEDGCPDRTDTRMFVTETTVEVIERIYFDAGKVDISSTGLAILDAIADTLRGNPQILKIEVQGHSDDTELKNQDQRISLSEARAAAVIDYLVTRGVARARLEPAGYGDTLPLDPAKTKEARAINRRVEFLILKTTDD